MYDAINLPNPDGIYRLLEAGEVIESKDAIYDPSLDHWVHILGPNPYCKGVVGPLDHLVGTSYDPQTLGPVRRFNKPKKESV